VHDPTRLFYSMWAPVWMGWQGRGRGGESCFGEGAGAQQFFENAFAGNNCQRNWLEGNHDYPVYDADAPALLGFGGASMMEHCLSLIGQWRHMWFANSRSIAEACIAARRNILRVKSGWTMCLNVEWQLCAARGSLPGQGNGGITFSPAPKDLRVDGNPSPVREGGQGVPIVETDVFYLEICVFHQICSNRDRLWTLNEGDAFECELDQTGFDELQRILRDLPAAGRAAGTQASSDAAAPPSPSMMDAAALPTPPPPVQVRMTSGAHMVASLNERWLNGQPSNDLSEAGVIMWVVDGDGRNLNGIDLDRPWAPIRDVPTGDRHSTSMVSKRHPYVFACFACAPDFQFNPGLVLAPSEATRSRLMCALHSDIGTYRYKCNPMGRSEGCRPGCGHTGVWCGRNPPWRTWQCAWPPEDLQKMMEMHDSLGMYYHGAVDANHVEQSYNELVFDSYTAEWEPALAKPCSSRLAATTAPRPTDGPCTTVCSSSRA
jgi:hypothetical protein